jgi:hypothetical protein
MPISYLQRTRTMRPHSWSDVDWFYFPKQCSFLHIINTGTNTKRGSISHTSFDSTLRAGWPDWANFRPLGDCLLWAVFFHLQKYLIYFPRWSSWINIDQKWIGQNFGLLFHKLIWSPWLRSEFSQNLSIHFSFIRNLPNYVLNFWS